MVKSKIIDAHRLLLNKTKETFVKKCDQISSEAKQKMALTTESDIQKRQQILSEQQNALNEALNVLTIDITHLNQKLLKDLEEEDSKMDSEKLSKMDTLINKL